MGALCCNPSKKSDSAWPAYVPKTTLSKIDSYLPPDYEPMGEDSQSESQTKGNRSVSKKSGGDPKESVIARKKHSDQYKRKKNVDSVPAPMNDSNATKSRPSSLKDKLTSSILSRKRGSGQSVISQDSSSFDFRQSRHHTGSMPSIREPTKKVRTVTSEEVSVKLGGAGDTDSTVSVVELSGWLEKKHPDRLGYQRRWIVLKGGYMLWDKEYRSIVKMNDPTERGKFKNEIDLAHLKHVCVVNTTARNKFEICRRDPSTAIEKSWVFRTHSAEECAEWVYAVRTQQAHASKRDSTVVKPTKKRTIESAID